MENINKVIEFHKATSSPILEIPKLAPMTRAELRIALLKEEIKELEDAIYGKNLPEVLDALVDIQYILNGTILEFGMQEIFQNAFNEVHASNMSKFCKTTAEARESVMQYGDNDIEAYYKKVGDQHVIMRSSDNKILKGLNYFAPKLKEMLKDFLRLKKSND